MGGSVAKWDAAMAASRLRNRRRIHLIWRGTLVLILLLSLIDHLWGRENFGDDWSRFDAKSAQFAGAIDGQTIAIRDEHGQIIAVRLLGVASFNDEWDHRSAQRLNELLKGQTLTLLLEPTQTRDSDGRLLAYVFTEDSEAISPQLVGEGLAIDDRRIPFAFHADVDQAESLAHRRHLGLWATANWRMMPAWRGQWFERKIYQRQE